MGPRAISKRTSVPRAVSVAALLLCGAVDPVQFWHGAHTWTVVSGYAGYVSEVNASDGDGIHHLRFYDGIEIGPISTRVYSHALTTGHEPEKTLSFLGIGTADQPYKDLDVGGDRVITAIRICTTDAPDTNARKLKGAEVWSARINPDGSLVATTVPTSRKFERSGCKQWLNKVSCATNQVATGIRSYGDQGFRGLALRCTMLRPL